MTLIAVPLDLISFFFHQEEKKKKGISEIPMKAHSIAISVPTPKQKSSLIVKTNLLLAKQPRVRERIQH